MHISSAGLRLIENFEGWSSAPYWDSYGGVWTRGYGETEGIGPHSPWLSRAQGEANLKRLVETRYEYAIRNLGVAFNQNQWDALCSFVWNLGAGIFQGSLGAELKARNFQGFADSMLAYDHAGGQVLQGLRTRREQERALFLQPGPSPSAYMPADEHNWLKEWDRIKARRTPAAHLRRVFLKGQMVRRRKLIWRKASGEPHGWDKLNRVARWRALKGRTG